MILKNNRTNDSILFCFRCFIRYLFGNGFIRCPHGVLEMVHDEGKDMHVVIKNSDQCTACGHCIKICNFGAIRLVDRIPLSSTHKKIQFDNKY